MRPRLLLTGLALVAAVVLILTLALRQQPLVVIQQLSIGGDIADTAAPASTSIPIPTTPTEAPTTAPLPAPLTLQSPRLQVIIDHIDPLAGGVRISGSVTNTSAEDVSVPIGAFELYDNAGASFIAGGAAATLKPGESTPLELTSPVSEGRTLTRLVLSLLPDAPVELELPPTAPLPGELAPEPGELQPTTPPSAPYWQARRP